MGLFDTLRVVVEALERAGIAHMVSGSVASARHGESRTTQDIDIVIDSNREQMLAFLHAVGETDLYVGDGLAALEHRSQFNLIDAASGWKVDLIIRKDRPYSRTEFERRQPTTVGGIDVFIVTPEDSILSKLEWSRESGSERQRRDVRSLLVARGSTLDWVYLRRWAAELGVDELLSTVMMEAEEPT